MIWKRKSRVVGQASCVLLLIALNCFLLPQASWAIGLGVDPGEVNIKDVPLGEVVKVSELGGEAMLLRIENKSASAFTYTIEILPTSKPGHLKAGYTNIPDTSWIWPGDKELRIEGNTTKAVELYLKIPESEEYYDKKYQAIIEVKSKKERPEELFVLACQTRMCFSTELSAEQKARLIAQEEEERLKAQKEEEQSAKHPRTITIIKTRDKWAEDPNLLAWLNREFPKSSIRTVDYSTRKGKRLAGKLKINFLPACIFSKDIEENKRFSAFSKAGSLTKQGRAYVLSATGRTGIFIKRKRRPHTLEIFCMSQCPFTANALDSIIDAKKEGRLPEDIKLDVHYIASLVEPYKEYGDKPTGFKFNSLHGQPEIDEDIRQLCIRKYYPEKFLDYLLLKSKDLKATDWEAPAKQAGIDAEVIKKCTFNQEGRTLLKEDIKKAEEFNISASPTFLYENRIIIVGFRLELLKELPGLEGL